MPMLLNIDERLKKNYIALKTVKDEYAFLSSLLYNLAGHNDLPKTTELADFCKETSIKIDGILGEIRGTFNGGD